MILAEVAISACLLLNISTSVAVKCEDIVKKVCFTDTTMRSYRDCFIKVAPQINVLMKRQYATTMILGEDDMSNKKPETNKKVEARPAVETVKTETIVPVIQVQSSVASIEALENDIAPFLDLSITHAENQREIDISVGSVKKAASIIKKELSFIKSAME